VHDLLHDVIEICVVQRLGHEPADRALAPNNRHEEAPDKLIQLAMLHAEFEAIHPFLDGNGRLGRMFVPLFMAQVGLIASPMFYISAYFEARRDEYYDRLLAVSRDNDWTGWCAFFLQAVQAQAEENQRKAQAILNLYDSLKHRFAELTRSQYAIHALDWLFNGQFLRARISSITLQSRIQPPSEFSSF